MAENFHIHFICIYAESQPNSLILSYKRLTGSAACVLIIQQVKSLSTLKMKLYTEFIIIFIINCFIMFI